VPVNPAVLILIDSRHHLVNLLRCQSEVQLTDGIAEFHLSYETILVLVHFFENLAETQWRCLHYVAELLDDVVLPLAQLRAHRLNSRAGALRTRCTLHGGVRARHPPLRERSHCLNT